jgi:5-carboxymethyl-2-hydroxymuconate isomerase
MPHVLIEYSANLRGQVDFPRFLAVVEDSALTTGVFPIGGIRVRAYEADHYRIADAHPDNAFIHIVLKVGHGRSVDTRRRVCETIFAAICEHLDGLYRRIPLGISLELQEIEPAFSFKKNNLHEHVMARQGKPNAE